MTDATGADTPPADDSGAATPPNAWADLAAAARRWIAGDPDPVTRTELAALVDAGDLDGLADRVGASLTFGTAGLRARVGAGPNRMNRAVVIRTTRGLADHLLAIHDDASERGVVVGFDARRDSETFAIDTVGVLAAAGIRVRWFPTPQPTPLVAFAQRHFDAAAAVVITASHNPAEDNGYKVYGEGAGQIVPPEDEAIAAAIAAVGPAAEVDRIATVRDTADADVGADAGGAAPSERGAGPPGPAAGIEELGEEVIEAYLAALAAARPRVDGPPPTLVYTPLHGVGGRLVGRALAEAGYDDVHVVAEQAEPDGEFPTVRFPNPEEPGALDAALALADAVGADVLLANDPDADRLAAAVPHPAGGFRPLTGNQIGVLLADHLLANTTVPRPLVVSSIVSTPMVHDVAASHGARSEVTLTGFKWIASAARHLAATEGFTFVYGFEEALGSSVGTVVADKDGIGAAVVFADAARALAGRGVSVWGRWCELCVEHGTWVSRQRSVTHTGAAGAARIAAAMRDLEPPESLAGHRVVSVTDLRHGAEDRPPWLAAHELVVFELDDGRAMIRPSGTEPKCKAYVDLRGETGSVEEVDAVSDALAAEADAVAEALLTAAGLR